MIILVIAGGFVCIEYRVERLNSESLVGTNKTLGLCDGVGMTRGGWIVEDGQTVEVTAKALDEAVMRVPHISVEP